MMMHVLLMSIAMVAATPDAPDTVVVCPREFREALEPWIRYRQRQSHRFELISNELPAEDIRAAIRESAKSGALRNIVLIGDAHPSADRVDELRRRCVPTHYAKANVNVHWGSEPEIATDNWYADLDDDLIPDLAIGRLTADDPAELSRMIRKIIDYENTADQGMWRRRVNFVAGVGGFGQVADTVLEMATKRFLTEGLPASFHATMTYGSWQSAFCPDPRHFHDATVNRFNEGCLFWVYIGHGQRQYLDRVRVPGARYHILDTKNMDALRPASGAPIAVFLACYTGAFDDPVDCLAEEMLNADGGPVAVLGGSRVTMPYAMAVMSNEMLAEYFLHRRETLGEVVLNAKRSMVAKHEVGENVNRQMLDTIAKLISPSAKMLDAEREEHLSLFNLLGDPLTRMRHPKTVDLEVVESVHEGDTLIVRGVAPLKGKCAVELVCRRDRTRFPAPTRNSFDRADGVLASYDETYEKANDTRWTTKVSSVDQGEFTTELPVPAGAFGPCHVRVFIEGENDFAMGNADILVRRKKTQ